MLLRLIKHWRGHEDGSVDASAKSKKRRLTFLLDLNGQLSNEERPARPLASHNASSEKVVFGPSVPDAHGVINKLAAIRSSSLRQKMVRGVAVKQVVCRRSEDCKYTAFVFI